MLVGFLKDQNISARDLAFYAVYTKTVPYKDTILHVSQDSTRETF